MSSTRKKICHIVFTFKIGGLENMLIDIMNKQVMYADVTLIVIKNMVDEEVLENLSSNVKIKFLSMPDKAHKLKTLLSVWYSIFNFKPDLIHVHEQGALKLFPFRFPIFRTQLIVTIHDTGINCGRELQWANSVYAISNSVLLDIQARYKIDPILNYNGIDFTTFTKKTCYSLNNKHFSILQVSRLHHEKKGQDILIKALASIKNEHPDFSFSCTFIGEGKSLPHLKNLVNDLTLNDNIKFLGLKAKSYIYQQLHKYDLLVQPSRYEGFGLTVAEGIAAKVPVLVSNIEGPMEVINNGEYGYSFESGDIDACKATLLTIIEDYNNGSIQKLTDRAYEYAYKNFNIERTAQVYAEV